MKLLRSPVIITALILSGFLLTLKPKEAAGQDITPPSVSFTYPHNGASSVSGNHRTAAITFSEPMHTGYVSFNHDSVNWGSCSFEWSNDHKTFYITRDSSAIIPNGTVISFTLSPSGSSNYFRDQAGNPLETYVFHFTIGTDKTPPTIAATIPGHGATGVDPDTDTVVITFNEAMIDDFSIQSSGSWGKSTHSVSPDRRILYMKRDNAGTPLPFGETIFITLNPDGRTNFRDLAGNALPEYTFTFTVGIQGEAPRVVSTSPADGAENVYRYLPTVTITFDRPMSTGYSISSSFPSYQASWSEDQRTITLSRNDLTQPLLAGYTYTFILNRDGSTSFRSSSGVPLEEYEFSFTAAQTYQLHKIEADPEKGFYWPYYLSIPDNLGTRTILLVETNNTGKVSDDWDIHDASAQNLARSRSNFAVDLNVPLLVPTFPRPRGINVSPPLWLIYTHALDRDSLITTVADLERIDLQLIAMINDAKTRLSSMGYIMDKKIFINGYSASGSFANRFTILHPEMIRAAASGSPGGWPTVPVSVWTGENLNYPVGIADIESLAGKPFNQEAFRKVPQYIYVGDKDENDAVDYRDGFDEADEEQINRLFGDGVPFIAERWPHAEEIFNSIGSRSRFVIYPGVEHTITAQMWTDLLAFFEARHPARSPLIRAIQSLQIIAGMDIEDIGGIMEINDDDRIGLAEALFYLQMEAELR